jgi:hypothetical protein
MERWRFVPRRNCHHVAGSNSAPRTAKTIGRIMSHKATFAPSLRFSYLSHFHFLVEIESSELSVSICHVASTICEADYEDDKADWQSENHQQRSRANGCAFIKCIVNEN